MDANVYIGDPNQVRCYDVKCGDSIWVSPECVDDYKPKIGSHLTICPGGYNKFIPILTTSYHKIRGEFIIKRIDKTEKKWWQFWKQKRILGYVLECLKI